MNLRCVCGQIVARRLPGGLLELRHRGRWWRLRGVLEAWGCDRCNETVDLMGMVGKTA